VDGFAGPGVYTRGEPGSPVIAIEQFLGHAALPVPIRVVLIEKDSERVERLRSELARFRPRLDANPSIRVDEPIEADASEAISAILDEQERSNKYGAALFFLDQFGYSAVSMEQIARIMRFQSFEVLALVHYRDLDRFLTDSTKASARDRMFGGNEWRPAIELGGADRRDFLLSTYKELLRSRARAGFVCAFPMFDKGNRPLHWLIFCSNSQKGLGEMKKAMKRVDQAGVFRFADRVDPNQGDFFAAPPSPSQLGAKIYQAFRGEVVTVDRIERFVLEETNEVNFKAALRYLESERKVTPIDAPRTRRPGTFPDSNLRVRFV
jgi:three-Cys-motif partner protein